MSRVSWYGGCAAALLLACPLTAVAQEPTPPEQSQPAQPGAYTDAQLQAFAAASAEIDPINQSLANASDEQRAQATERIRAILQQNNLDVETYNAIAARAQADPALAAQIAALRSPDSGGGAAQQE